MLEISGTVNLIQQKPEDKLWRASKQAQMIMISNH
jgi:hypothetical protein